jgi:hypothetical protein
LRLDEFINPDATTMEMMPIHTTHNGHDFLNIGFLYALAPY